MAILRIQKADAIIFQLVRLDLAKNVSSTDAQKQGLWEEVQVFPMATKPESIDYNYSSRSAITQTEPENGIVDRFGQKLPVVTISGTFGLKQRRVGAVVKDGYTRLIEFRDELFKRSQQARPVTSDSMFGKKYGSDDSGTQYVYAVNYYDYIYDEQWSTNLDNLKIRVDAKRNPFEPTYSMTFTALGDPIKAKTNDGQLLVLQATSDLIDSGELAINNVYTKLLNSGPGMAIGAVIGGLTELQYLSGAIAALGISYAQAVAGQVSPIGPNGLSALSTKSIFTTVKG